MRPLNRRSMLLASSAFGCHAVLLGNHGFADIFEETASQSARTNGSNPDVAWLKEVQVAPTNELAELPRLSELLKPSATQVITTRDEWEKERKRLREEWLEFLGPMPKARPPVITETIQEDHPDGVTRRLIRYTGEPGFVVEGYLLIPDDGIPGKGSDGKRAGIVALHPTSNDTIHEIAGVRGKEIYFQGLELARQGFVVFCPECFLWQDVKTIQEAVTRFKDRRPTTKGMHKMLYDAMRGVDVLESFGDIVDRRRIGAMGHSLGAKETLYLCAFDDRVQAGVFSEGGIGFPSTNWHDPWYLGNAVKEPTFPLAHHQLLAMIAPRPFLILGGETGPGAADGDRSWPYVAAALPVYNLYGSVARIGLYNHGEGHSISPKSFARIVEWLKVYLCESR